MLWLAAFPTLWQQITLFWIECNTLYISLASYSPDAHVQRHGAQTGLIIIYCQKWQPGKHDMQQMWVAAVTSTALRWSTLTTTSTVDINCSSGREGSYIMVRWVTVINLRCKRCAERFIRSRVQTSVKLHFSGAFVITGNFLVLQTHTNCLVNVSLSGH